MDTLLEGETDEIIKSIETHEAIFVYGEPYVGKSILAKKVMFEMVDKGYTVIHSSSPLDVSSAIQIQDLLTALLKKYPKILLIADDAHKAANRFVFEIFDELHGGNIQENLHFLFVAREKQLNKEISIVERALRKIPREAQFHIGFSLDDAFLFLKQSITVTPNISEEIMEEITTNGVELAQNMYQSSKEDPYMFSLLLKFLLLKLGDTNQEISLEPENIVSKEMSALITRIEEIEKTERFQNNELWRAAIMSAVMGIGNITIDYNNHSIFTCSRIIPRLFHSLKIISSLRSLTMIS